MKLLSSQEVIEETPVGRYVETMLSSTAQFDNEVRGERSKNGMIEAVRNGRYVWPAPRGFVNTGGRGKSNLAQGGSKIVSLLHKFWVYVDTGCEVEEARRKIAEEGLKIPKEHAGELLS